MVIAFHPASLRRVHEFEDLSPQEQGVFIEWLVAQEIWRRAVLHQNKNPEAIGFWRSKENEIDFVTPNQRFIEVKRGKASPFDFHWFRRIFPNKELTVICSTPFSSKGVQGITLEEFLLQEDSFLISYL